MIINTDFVTNSSSVVNIVIIPIDFKVEIQKLKTRSLQEYKLKEETNKKYCQRLNLLLDSIREEGNLHSYNEDEVPLIYYILEYLPKKYILDSFEMSNDGGQYILVLSRNKIKILLETAP